MVLSMNNFDTDAKVELTNSKFSFRSNASFTYNYLFTKQHKGVFGTGILSTSLKVSIRIVEDRDRKLEKTDLFT